jgi:hypothetical protein
MTRRLRLAVGFVPVVALYLAQALGERLMTYADVGFWRLRDWMDVAVETGGRTNG